MAIQKLAYTFEEAAEQCGYLACTLKQAVADGKLTARYVNTEGVIRHEDLAAWIGQLPTKPGTGTSAAQTGASPDKEDHKPKDASKTAIDPVKEDPKPPRSRQAKAPQSPRPESESEWLTPNDVANMLQVSPGTLANWRTSKSKGPAFRRLGGGLIRYSPLAVEDWLKAQPSQ